MFETTAAMASFFVFSNMNLIPLLNFVLLVVTLPCLMIFCTTTITARKIYLRFSYEENNMKWKLNINMKKRGKCWCCDVFRTLSLKQISPQQRYNRILYLLPKILHSPFDLCTQIEGLELMNLPRIRRWTKENREVEKNAVDYTRKLQFIYLAVERSLERNLSYICVYIMLYAYSPSFNLIYCIEPYYIETYNVVGWLFMSQIEQ